MGRTAVAKLLLERGADPQAKNPGGRTALDYARILSSIEIVELLIRAEMTAGQRDTTMLESAVDLRLGMEAYRRGDFERAGQFFARADSAGQGKAGARAMLLKTEESSYAWAMVSAQSKESAAPLQDFLRRYPSGTYAQKARELLPMVEDLEIQARFERRKATTGRGSWLPGEPGPAVGAILLRVYDLPGSRPMDRGVREKPRIRIPELKGVVDTLLMSGERREIRIRSERHGLPVRYRSFDDSEMGRSTPSSCSVSPRDPGLLAGNRFKGGGYHLLFLPGATENGAGDGNLSVSESEAMMQPEYAVILQDIRRTGEPGLRK